MCRSRTILPLRKNELDRRKAKFAAVRKALDTLAENPADVEANSVAGQWYCFVKGDWEKGLPLLAKGKNAGLADLARRATWPNRATPGSRSDWPTVGGRRPKRNRAAQVGRASEGRPLVRVGDAEACRPGPDESSETPGDRRRGCHRGCHSAGETLLPTGPAVRSVVQAGDVALAKNGAKVQGPTLNPDDLLDGNSTEFDNGHGYAWSETPCEWIITLDKVYRLREIRFRLYDKDDRSSNYILLVSTDGGKYVQVVDRSRGVWRSWQSITFTPRPVKTIKLVGVRPRGRRRGIDGGRTRGLLCPSRAAVQVAPYRRRHAGRL